MLNNGMDILTAKGAAVVWNVPPVENIIVTGRVQTGPFHQAFDRLIHERTDIRLAESSGPDLVEALRISRRHPPSDGLRVLLVGDSSSLTMGYGMERWANERGGITLWSAGVAGCGMASDGFTLDAGGRETPFPDRCQTVLDDFTDQIEEFDPDVVLVLSTRFDLAPRRLAAWDDFEVPGDPKADDYLVDSYTKAYDALSAGGAKVVWLRSPCPPESFDTGFGRELHPLQNETVVHVNDVVLGRVAEQRPDLRFFDLYGALCPDGQYHEGQDGIEHVRPDGIHFSAESSRWLANTYGQQMIDAASS